VRKYLLGIQLIGIFAGTHVFAQGLKPVTTMHYLDGYQCMALAANYGPDGIHAPPAAVYAGPENNAPQIGLSGAVIIVPDPLKPENGRTITIQSSGSKAWIDVDLLTHWHALSDPAAVCRPALLSNGRYGFRTHD
jgi:hypothetical protein